MTMTAAMAKAIAAVELRLASVDWSPEERGPHGARVWKGVTPSDTFILMRYDKNDAGETIPTRMDGAFSGFIDGKPTILRFTPELAEAAFKAIGAAP
jgi:hypothetical protein